jgi:hypothetical protein
MLYDVHHMPAVGQQIRDLAKRAAAHGSKAVLVSVLKRILEKLRSEPSVWGDPEYNLRKPGGCVYHGILEPLQVQYAVFEPEKIIYLMNVRTLPNAGF